MRRTVSRIVAPRLPQAFIQTAGRRAASSAPVFSGNVRTATNGRWGIAALLAFTAGSGYLYWSSQASADEKKPAAAKGAMDPTTFTDYTLIQKTILSHNTAIYRFQLDPGMSLNLPVASFILVQADTGEEKPTVRPYTPITYDEKGYFELVVKSYPEGKVSKYFSNMKIGDTLAMKGPLPKIEYKPNMKKQIAMIAGGSGITPMLQVIHEILKNPQDKTEISLIFANQTKDDILLKERIDALAKKHKNFKVTYTLDNPPSGWTGEKGFVSEAMVKKYVPPPSDDVLVLVCGPPGMMKAVSGPKTPDYKQGEVAGVLKALGFNEKQVFKF